MTVSPQDLAVRVYHRANLAKTVVKGSLLACFLCLVGDCAASKRLEVGGSPPVRYGTYGTDAWKVKSSRILRMGKAFGGAKCLKV